MTAFLLLIDDLVVARDVTELLAAAAPDATVHAPRDLPATADALGGMRFDVLLTTLPVAELHARGIARAARLGGVRIVVLDGTERPAAEVAEGWTFVDSPFTEKALLDALLREGGGERSA